MAECKLCGNESEKLVRAHLIPGSFYDSIREGQDRLISIPGNELTPFGWTYDGVYDFNILCANCDNNILGELDKYGHEILTLKKFNIDFKEYLYGDGHQFFFMKGIDTNKLKLFILSVIWRYSVSKELNTANFSLGETCENEIRDMILRRDSGYRFKYATFIEHYQAPPGIFSPTLDEEEKSYVRIYLAPWLITTKIVGDTPPELRILEHCYLGGVPEPLVMYQDESRSLKITAMMKKMISIDPEEARRRHGEYRRSIACNSGDGVKE